MYFSSRARRFRSSRSNRSLTVAAPIGVAIRRTEPRPSGSGVFLLHGQGGAGRTGLAADGDLYGDGGTADQLLGEQNVDLQRAVDQAGSRTRVKDLRGEFADTREHGSARPYEVRADDLPVGNGFGPRAAAGGIKLNHGVGLGRARRGVDG